MRITREIGIDMGHRVTNHGGKCKNLHGHRYRIEVTLAGPTIASGAEEGMVMDFGFLKDLMMEIIDAPCDHGMCLWIKDVQLNTALGPSLQQIAHIVEANGFMSTNWSWGKLYVLGRVPTAENLARHWFDRLHEPVLDHIGAQGGRLHSVRVWETPNCNAVYKMTPKDRVFADEYVNGLRDPS